jgi:hypothetical protein
MKTAMIEAMIDLFCVFESNISSLLKIVSHKSS